MERQVFVYVDLDGLPHLVGQVTIHAGWYVGDTQESET
jgi:hypothetical protein